MYIKKLYLKNFRNYREQTIELNENANVFYGNNAQNLIKLPHNEFRTLF